MDPNATLDLYAEAMKAKEYDAAEDHASDLYHWLSRGAFLPLAWAELTHPEAMKKARGMIRDASAASFNADAI